MKVSFAPLVVLFVSSALVDAISEKPDQGSSSLAIEKSGSEVNANKADIPKDFEVESIKSRPEDAEAVEAAPVLAESKADEKTNSVKHINTDDDNEDTENIKAAIDEEDDDDDDDDKINSVNPDEIDEKSDIVKSDDDNEEVDDVKAIDNDENFDNVKIEDDNVKAFDENVKAIDDENDIDALEDIEDVETAVEESKDESIESVNSPDEAEITKNYSVSTVYTTVTSTVTDCESYVTVCPEIGSVVTKTISLYTTVCPETTSVPSIPLVTAPAIPDPSEISFLTKTVSTTVWYTVTECPPQEADCFVGLETSSVATYLDVQEMTYNNPHTVDEEVPFPTTTMSKPYVTGSPSINYAAPQSNVTMPVVPLNPTYDGASSKNFDGFAMYLGLAVAATATLFLQGWY